ncbi:MAG: porin family protein [Acidobacteriota bacterium]
MKKFGVLLLAVFSVALFASQAQAQGVTYGLKAGLNLANVTIKTSETDMPAFKSQMGLVEGIFVNFKLGPVTIQPELLYSQRGTKWNEYTGTDAVVTGHMRLSYLEVPILVKYSFLSGPAKPFILAGPSIAFLMKSGWGIDVDYTDPDSMDYNYMYDFKNLLKKTDFAGVFGIGVDYKLPKFVVSLEARYYLGFTNVANADLQAEMGITSAKNKGFSILIGIGL